MPAFTHWASSSAFLSLSLSLSLSPPPPPDTHMSVHVCVWKGGGIWVRVRVCEVHNNNIYFQDPLCIKLRCSLPCATPDTANSGTPTVSCRSADMCGGKLEISQLTRINCFSCVKLHSHIPRDLTLRWHINKKGKMRHMYTHTDKHACTHKGRHTTHTRI
jgi:hypothetical protein